MALIKLVAEDQASGDVKQVFDEIKSRYQIDFVPNIMKAWAHNAGALRNNWERIKHHEDVLGMELAHAVGLSIASSSPCNYCMDFHTMVLERLGWSPEKLENLVSWAAQNVGGNVYANGLRLEIDSEAVQMIKKAA
ncbi:MAG: carboxymuconolactone decarboxylase family protein [Actinomycetota bacterium]|nr:carboxymuconolactone decarboxylase family protein [Actinomycetota bacterium]